MMSPAQRPLGSVAGRSALLVSIASGIATKKEIEAAVINDNEPRPYRVPVVVEGRKFSSITAGAEWLFYNRKALYRSSRAGQLHDIPRILANLKKRIARYCNADNVVGYYWDVRE